MDAIIKTLLAQITQRGNRERDRREEWERSLKPTQYKGNNLFQEMGGNPIAGRYLGQSGLIPGQFVPNIGRNPNKPVIPGLPIPVETIEDEIFIPLNINVFAEIENTPSLIEELEVLNAKSLIINIVITRTYGFVLEIRIDLLHWRLLGVLIERVERPGFGIVETDDGSASFSSSLGFFSGTATDFAAACIFGWGQVLDAVRGSLTYSVVGDGVGDPSSVNIGSSGFFEPASGIFDLLEYGTVLNSSIVSTGGNASGTFENAEHSFQVRNNTPLVCVDKGIWYVWTYFYENIGDITSINYAVDYWVGVSGRTSVGSVKKKVYARKTIDNFPQPITFEFAFLEDFDDLTYDQFTFSPEEISIEDFRETPLSSQLIWAATRDNT